MYKFYFIDLKHCVSYPNEYADFFTKWDLYYMLEHDLSNGKDEDRVLKKEVSLLRIEVLY